MNCDEIRMALLHNIGNFLRNVHVPDEMIHKYHNAMEKIHWEMMSILKMVSTAENNKEFEYSCDDGKFRSPQKRRLDLLNY